MKKIIILVTILILSACAELQEAVNQLPEGTFNQLPNVYGSAITDDQIAAGLRAALDQGIEQQVSKLAQTDGF